MSKIVLIRGFAIGLTTLFFRPSFGSSASFGAFDKMIKSGEAAVFPWGIEQKVNLFQLLNPFFLVNHYEDERFLAQARETHERLRVFLEQEQPEIIVCHSMGCFLLNNYLKNFILPKSVCAVIFSQSDDTYFSTSIPVHNLYCPWDPTLLVSSFYHKKWRAGLWPICHASVQNVFFPLLLPINLHTSGIRDPRLADYVSKL